MRPPICAICQTDFRDSVSEGGLVQFKLTESEVEHNNRLNCSDITGHPAGLEWFCGAHIKSAKKLQHLSRKEALNRLQHPMRLQDSMEMIKVRNIIKIFNIINNNWDNILRMFINDNLVLSKKPKLVKNKSWSPMDNTVAPNCPYIIESENVLEHGSISIINRYRISYWNKNSINQALYSFSIRDLSKALIRLTADSSKNCEINKMRFVSDTLKTDEFNNIKKTFLSYF